MAHSGTQPDLPRHEHDGPTRYWGCQLLCRAVQEGRVYVGKVKSFSDFGIVLEADGKEGAWPTALACKPVLRSLHSTMRH